MTQSTEAKKKVTMSEEQLQALIQQIKAEVTESVKAELAAERSQKAATRSAGKIQIRAYEILENPEFVSLTYDQIAEKIRAEFDSKTTSGCIAWYISNAKKYGKTPLHRVHK